MTGREALFVTAVAASRRGTPMLSDTGEYAYDVWSCKCLKDT